MQTFTQLANATRVRNKLYCIMGHNLKADKVTYKFYKHTGKCLRCEGLKNDK